MQNLEYGIGAVGYLIVAGILWSIGLVSLVLTVVGLALRSWRLLWVAFCFAVVFSVAAALSIGPFVLLLVALQLASAVALRRSFDWRGWVALITTAILIWVLAFPFQVWIIRFPLLLVLIPIGLIAAIVATVTAPIDRPDPNATI